MSSGLTSLSQITHYPARASVLTSHPNKPQSRMALTKMCLILIRIYFNLFVLLNNQNVQNVEMLNCLYNGQSTQLPLD